MELLASISAYLQDNPVLTIISTNTIVIALFSFLGKIMHSRIIQKERFVHDQNILGIKDRLDKENQELKENFDRIGQLIDFNLSKSLHIDKTQFDFEYKLYRKLWKSLVELKKSIYNLRPIGTFLELQHDNDEVIKNKIDCFESSHTEVQNIIEYNQPFFSEKIYIHLKEILDLSFIEFAQFLSDDRKDVKKYYETAQRNKGEIVRLIDATFYAIKERFNEIKTI